jgi:DNA-binding transcriptional regulator YiaG
MKETKYKCSECGEILKEQAPNKAGLICDKCGEEYAELDIETLEKVKVDAIIEKEGDKLPPPLKKEKTIKEKIKEIIPQDPNTNPALTNDGLFIKEYPNEKKENKETINKKETKEAKKGRDEKGRFIEGNNIAEGNEGGRPPEYKEEYNQRVDDYLKERQDEDKRTIKQENEEKGYKMFDIGLKVKLPTIEGFARYIGVNKTTLYEWEKKNSVFSNSLEKIRVEQKERLLNMGLSGDYNPTIAKLILSSNHGMAEKTEQDVNVKNPVVVKVIKEEILK